MPAKTRSGGARRPAYSILISPDTLFLKQEAERLLALYPPKDGKWERKMYWGDEEPSTQFWDAFVTQSLFGGSQCLLVHQAEKWPETVWKKLDRRLPKLSSSCWPILFINVPFKKNAPDLPARISKSGSYRTAEKNGWIFRRPGITDKTVSQYILERVQHYPHIPKPVVQSLATSVLLDALAIENELIRLETYYGAEGTAGSRNPSQIREREMDVFETITHVLQGNQTAVIMALLTNSEPDVYFPLSSLLDREIRILWQLRTGKKAPVPPFMLETKTRQAQQFSFRQLARAESILVEAEWNMKQNITSQAQSLEWMLIELTRVFGLSRRGRS